MLVSLITQIVKGINGSHQQAGGHATSSSGGMVAGERLPEVLFVLLRE